MRYPIVERVARKTRTEPDPKFEMLANIGQQAKKRGHFTKAEFLEICRWKSHRRIALCSSNSEKAVKDRTAFAFSAKDERSRIEALLKLTGVAVPTASALLAASSPTSFGVIDIRAWQFLYSVGIVAHNRKGLNLSVRNWLQYLAVLREVASRVKTTPRLVEISLYNAHKAAQKGPLYQSSSAYPSVKRTCQKLCFCQSAYLKCRAS